MAGWGLVLAAALALAPADRPVLVQVGRVTVVTWPAHLALATHLAELADRPAEWPGLGRRDPGPLRLILAPDDTGFARLAAGRAPDWGAGIALPGARTILLRRDGTDLTTTLRHELAHLALHEAVRVRLPRWFDEGYAQWAAGEWDRLDALELNLAVVRGRVPDFRTLDADLRGSALAAGTAYSLAVSAVLELGRRNPGGSLAPLLRRLEGGTDFEAAVLATTGLTLPQFEEAWRGAVKRRYTLLTWLAAGGLWGVAGAGLGLAAWLRRRRDRPRRAALDDGWTLPPDVEADAGADVLDPRTPGQ